MHMERSHNNSQIKPYDFSEWPSEELTKQAGALAREMKHEFTDSDFIDDAKRDVNHMIFEVWYRQQRGSDVG
jgi:hypothetical protein